jgi:methyl-accepting chemotaxis protein
MRPFFFRRKILTHRAVQIRLASVCLLWLLAFAAVFGFIFLLNYEFSSGRTEMMMIHDQLLAKVILLDQSRQLLIWYGFAALVYFILLWCYLIVYSHRLTGPIYKITQTLQKAAESGEFPPKISFRRHDAFPELAKAFNQLLENWDKLKRR